MEKRSNSNRAGKLKSDTLVIVDSSIYNNVEQMQSVISKFPARLIYTGLVTGKLYVWDNAGSVVSVSVEDVPDLLSKRLGEGACCGSSQRGNPLFELI